MAKSFPYEEKDAWDVKLLLEVGWGILAMLLLLLLCDVCIDEEPS